MKKIIIAILFTITSQLLISQEIITVQGTVKADSDKSVLPYVNIIIKGTQIGVSTDFDGNFTIAAPNNGTLVISYLGYVTKEVEINKQKTINIFLKEDAQQLDEIVVVGYGSQKKSDVVGSVSSVKVSDIQNIPLPRADEALQGQVAGVNITNNDASPNANISIRVRGVTSINGGNNPLIVIDGVQGASLSDIHPNDIESMEVLKDASATAIYGSRGASGVILITSKKGRNRKPVITYNTFMSIHQVRKKLDLMNAFQYSNFINENRTARGLPTVFTNAEIDNFRTNSTDWQNEIFRTGISTNHHLNISGGSDNIVYSLSGDFIENKGVVLGSKYTRYSFRPNITYKHNDKLKINLNSFVSLAKDNPTVLNSRDRQGSPIYAALLFSPTKPVFNADGTYSQPGGGAGSNTEFNPVALALEPIRDNFSDRIILNPSVEYDFNENFSIKVMGSFQSIKDENNFYYNEKVVNGGESDREASIANSKWTSYQNSNILTYNKKIKDHNVKITGVFEQQIIKSNNNFISSSNFLSNANTYNNLGLGASPGIPFSYKEEQSLESFMARIDYSYKGKYSVTLTGRSDASSVFAKNNKRAFFPSVGLAWNVSEEKFLRDAKNINSLKIRASYGEIGNAAISPYQSLSQLVTGANFSFNGSTLTSGVNLSTQAENPNLKWETTKQLNFGFDLGLFNGALNIVADYYKKNTVDLLQERALFQASGFQTQLVNAGEVLNEGFEIAISGTPVRNDKFKWNTNLTFSMNRNEVLSLTDNQTSVRLGGAGLPGFSDAIWLEVGQPIGLIKGLEYAGVWKSNEAVLASAYGTTPGSPKYVDQNNDGVINNDDFINIANALPDYTFGWNNTFTYGNFSLNTLIIGSQGNDIYNIGRSRTESSDDGTSVNLLNAWTPNNENTNVPGHDQVGAFRNSSRWVEDGSYLRLKNVTLGYDFSDEVTNSLNISSLRLYFTGTNLLTITDYTGFDPESNNSNGVDTFAGVDLATYPSQKRYTLGLDIKF
ncbi:TonB-dependent receptor [Polaribacter batillariae]|uniref:TonB-dependent receptor n=1 Tax=Polaribacter batillariae TaxID=2808900 RepID=A0ABX7T0B7_9FLAO|nr:TonB-dependent receptor [Polaribacter batillariae]QTD38970.1 TonB-dependent receptor [Polaribacter batillariae]